MMKLEPFITLTTREAKHGVHEVVRCTWHIPNNALQPPRHLLYYTGKQREQLHHDIQQA